ncbi:hypothetical protein VH566_06795 [Rhizobium wenxiniae]
MKLALAAFGVPAFFISSAFAYALEPIPGSIIYQGQPAHRLQKSPVGSTFTHEFTSGLQNYTETYKIQPDRSLVIIDRSLRSNNR